MPVILNFKKTEEPRTFVVKFIVRAVENSHDPADHPTIPARKEHFNIGGLVEWMPLCIEYVSLSHPQRGNPVCIATIELIGKIQETLPITRTARRLHVDF